MKIILASNKGFIFKHGYQLTGIPKADLRIGYVITAALGASDKAFLEESRQKMQAAFPGLQEIDIAGKSLAQLRTIFADKNIIQVEGGNPFYLLKAIRESGFDVLLKELLAQGVVYIGASAGSYVMCPTIEVAAWKESRERYGLNDLRALNYVPFLIKAHYTDAIGEKIQQSIQKSKYPLRLLRDGQAFLIEDGRVTFCGDGSEPRL